MLIYCIEEFKTEFVKLKGKKAYRTLESSIIDYFFNKTAQQLNNGTRLNHSETAPFIKKRLRGKGGYRFYFLLLIKDDNAYLSFVHPKTGPYGSDNITDESKAMLQKRLYESIKNKDLHLLSVKDDKSLQFDKLK